MIRTVQVTNISFDCSLDDWEWTEKDQLEEEEKLHQTYIGMVVELDVSDDADDEEVVEELLEEISCSSGWCINNIDFRYILK